MDLEGVGPPSYTFLYLVVAREPPPPKTLPKVSTTFLLPSIGSFRWSVLGENEVLMLVAARRSYNYFLSLLDYPTTFFDALRPKLAFEGITTLV